MIAINRVPSIAGIIGILIAVAPLPAAAACTWSFNWYCSDCAKLKGRTTGTQDGYPTEAACDGARRSVARGVTTGSCTSSGICESPSTAVPRPTDPAAPRRPGVVGPDEYELEQQRLLQAGREQQMRFEAEEAARAAAAKAEKAAAQRKLESDRIEALGSLKSFDGDRTSVAPPPADPTGLKPLPSAPAVLKTPDPPRANAPRDAKAATKSPAPALASKTAPAPEVLRLGERTANLVLDAIERSGHDLDDAERLLDNTLYRQPMDQDVRDALAHVIGMGIGEHLAGMKASSSDVPLLEQLAKPAPTLDRLQQAPPADLTLAQFNEFKSWDTQFRRLALDAMQRHGNDYEAAQAELEDRVRKNSSDMALRSALRSVQGVAIYQADIDKARAAGARK